MVEGIRIVDHDAFAQFVRDAKEAKRKARAVRRSRQKRLLSGLGCVPGQQDLFPTDGESQDA
jgi:hypothetical protein